MSKRYVIPVNKIEIEDDRFQCRYEKCRNYSVKDGCLKRALTLSANPGGSLEFSCGEYRSKEKVK